MCWSCRWHPFGLFWRPWTSTKPLKVVPRPKKAQKNTTMQPKNRNMRQTASILLIIDVVATWLLASQPSVNRFPKTIPSHQSCRRFSVTNLYISTDFSSPKCGRGLQDEASELSRVSSAVHIFNPTSFWSLWSSKPPFYRWTSWRQLNQNTARLSRQPLTRPT
mgnify:CR=1 FL=1